MSKTTFPGFSPKLVKFLRELDTNNNRAWFEDNKQRYVSEVREPALDFIEAMGVALRKVAPHLRARQSCPLLFCAPQ